MPERRTFEEIAKEARDSAPLPERVESCRKRIGEMCRNGRPPRMSVPVRYEDDDVFIGVVLDDCAALHITVEALRVAAGRMVRAGTLEEKLTANVEFAQVLDAAFGTDGW